MPKHTSDERPAQRRRIANACQTVLENQGVGGLPIVAEAILAYLVVGDAPEGAASRDLTRDQVENWLGGFSTFHDFLNAVANALLSNGSQPASIHRLTKALRSFDGFLQTPFPTAGHLLDLSNQQMSRELWQMLAHFTGHYVDLLIKVHQEGKTKLLPALFAHVLTTAFRVNADMDAIGCQEKDHHLHLLKSFHAAGPLFHKYMQKFSAKMVGSPASREAAASFKNRIEPMSMKQLTAALQRDGAFVRNRVQVAHDTIRLVLSANGDTISMPAKAAGSASMAEGHTATRKKADGRFVGNLFLKVQRPNLAESIDAEMLMMQCVLDTAMQKNPAASDLLRGNFGLIKDAFAEIRAELTVADEFGFAQAAARSLNNQNEPASPYDVRSVSPVHLGEAGESPQTVLALQVAPGRDVQSHISERGVTAELPEAYLAAFRTWMENVFRMDGTGFLHADPHLGNLFFRERTHAPPSKPALTFIDFGNSDNIPQDFPLADKIADFCTNAGMQNAQGLLEVFPLAPGQSAEHFRWAYEQKIRTAGQVNTFQFFADALGPKATEAEFRAWKNAFEVVIQFNVHWALLEGAGRLNANQKRQRREGKLLIKTLEALMMKWEGGWKILRNHGTFAAMSGPLDLWKQKMFSAQANRRMGQVLSTMGLGNLFGGRW